MAETIGRYEIIKELGRGGMATVYLAHDPRFRRDVAIKVLPPQFTHDPRFLTRFVQEAQTIAALEDPAIVPVHDFGEQDNVPYIVMRYMNGGSLREQIAGKPLALAYIVTILNRLAPALDKAHQRGIIHRDLKPDNVLFDEEKRPYLADFGIARMAEATHTMTIVGTPAYMSPEQVQGKQKLDWRSDLYALGVMLFEMFSGQKPYEAQTPSGQMFMHVMEPVPDLLALNPHLPPQAQEVIEKAMAKDREERYQSAAEMAGGVASLQEASDASTGSVSREVVAAAIVKSPETKELLEPSGLAEVQGGVPSTGSRDGSAGIALQKTEIDMPMEPKREDAAPDRKHDPLPATELAVAAGMRAEIAKGEERRPLIAMFPAWAWWAGALVILLLLVFGLRSIFLGGDSTPEEGQDVAEVAAVVAPQATATETDIPPTATVTATESPTATYTPRPTKTPTLEPTPTADPYKPPPNPDPGTVWLRPQDEMKMVYVPGGSFMMGSEDGYGNEQPVHQVTLDGFWMGQTEVTNEQFATFLNEMGNQEEGGAAWFEVESGYAHVGNRDETFIAESDFADHPVIEVSWYGAAAYCDWIDGSLPTEAQWEYAARGPESKKYPWGEDDPTCDLAQFGECGGSAVPVGNFEDGASWVGAMDMAGNVWEWVSDWYDENYYATSPEDNPPGPENGDWKVLRGGSWINLSINLRSSNRHNIDPEYRNNKFGFRCALLGE